MASITILSRALSSRRWWSVMSFWNGRKCMAIVASVQQMLASGVDVILTLDVQGAAITRQLFPEAVTVFILPPSYEALLNRLQVRDGGNTESLDLRLRNAEGELMQYQFYDYLIVNDELERAVQEFAAIIVAERCRRKHRAEAAERILNYFRRNKTNG
jgi:guanylate kinase